MTARGALALLSLLACASPPPPPVEAPTEIVIAHPSVVDLSLLDTALADKLAAEVRWAKCDAACMKLAIEGASRLPASCTDDCAEGRLFDPDCVLTASASDYVLCTHP